MSIQDTLPSPAIMKHDHNDFEKPSDLFVKGMLEMPSVEYKRRNPMQLAVSVLLHVAVIALLVVVPAYFIKQAAEPPPPQVTLLYAPPAPRPAPPPPAGAQARPKVARPTPTPILKSEPLVAPRIIPKSVESASNEAQSAAAPDLGVLGGVPGGTPGGVLGGLLGGSGPAAPPPPQIVHVGGNVKPPELLKRVEPSYPTIARMAHIEGTVDIDAVIDPHGNVVQERAVDGPSLLVPAALQAVEQWKYQPTYLNGQPVALDMEVSVSFHLDS